MIRYRTWAVLSAVFLLLAGVAGVSAAQAAAKAPQPVYAAAGHHADAGVAAAPDGFRAYLTPTATPIQRSMPLALVGTE